MQWLCGWPAGAPDGPRASALYSTYLLRPTRSMVLTQVSFDLASRTEGEGEPTAEAASLFSVLGGRSCDYQGTVLPDPPSIFC